MDISINKIPVASPGGPMIAHANWFQFSAGEVIKNTYVESRMFLWCIKGKGHVEVDDKGCELVAGGWLFTPWKHQIIYEADQRDPFLVGGIHVIPYHEAKHKVEFRVAHRKGDSLANRSCRRDASLADLDGMVSGLLRASDRLFLLGAYAIDLFQGAGLNEITFRGLADILISELRLARLRDDASPSSVPGELHRIQVFIRSHLKARLLIRDLADVAGCSVPSVHRLFRDYTNTTPGEWIAHLRIQRAKELLRTTNASVQSVGEEVGFPDPFHFSRFFKNQTSVSPREYRQSQWF